MVGTRTRARNSPRGAAVPTPAGPIFWLAISARIGACSPGQDTPRRPGGEGLRVLYVRPQLVAVRDAVNRAENGIDGQEVTGNVVDFRQEATPTATETEKQTV